MRRFLFYSIPIWKLLVLGGVLLLLHLASAPGCKTNDATIMNSSGSVANVTLSMRDIVVWRGKIEAGGVVTASYRVVASGSVKLRAEYPEGAVEGGAYVDWSFPSPQTFVVERDRVSMVYRAPVGEPWRTLEIFRAVSSCGVQSVLDLTGAADPATLQ